MNSPDLFDNSIVAELVGGAHHRVPTKAAGRVCSERGCRTVLSIYNPHARCSFHDYDTSLAHFHVAPLDDVHRALVARGAA